MQFFKIAQKMKLTYKHLVIYLLKEFGSCEFFFKVILSANFILFWRVSITDLEKFSFTSILLIFDFIWFLG